MPDYNSLRYIAYFGLPLYFCFLAVSSYKVFYFYRHPEPANFKHKFHIALTISFFFDEIYYISLLLLDRMSGWGYPMHMLAVLFNMAAFSQVILFWSRTFHFGGEFEEVRKVVFYVVLLNAILIFVGCVIMFVGSYANIFACIVALVYGFSLLLFGSWMLKYGLQLHSTLSSQHQQRVMQQNDTKKRIYELYRINFVLIVCIFFYTFRAIVLIMIFLWNMNIIPEKHGGPFDTFLWYIFSLWVPQLVPDTLLMYLMRPQSDVSKHKSSSSVNGVQLGDDYDKDSEEGDRDNRFSDISLGRSSSIDEQRARKQSNDEEIYSSFNPARLLSNDSVGGGPFSNEFGRQSGGTNTVENKSNRSSGGSMVSWLFTSTHSEKQLSDTARQTSVSASISDTEGMDAQKQESTDAEASTSRRSMDIF